MPWSFALPQPIFASPFLAVATPIATGNVVALLVNRNKTQATYRSLRQPPFRPCGPCFLVAGRAGRQPQRADSLHLAAGAQFHVDAPLFRIRAAGTALGDLTLLAGNVGMLMANWWKADRTAFWLMVPYSAWLAYVAYLNTGVGILNNWALPEKKSE